MMKIRRRKTLFMCWEAGDVHVISPLDGRTRIKLGRRVNRLLDSLDDWSDTDTVIEAEARTDDERRRLGGVIETLVGQGLVDIWVPGDAEPDGGGEPWERWGGVAEMFHRHTRDATYLTDAEEQRAYTERLVAVPSPDIFKAYPGAKEILLPRSRLPLDETLGRVLQSRRTHRHFVASAVSLPAMSTLLQIAFGPQQFVDGGVYGTLQLRTSPNAGSRHEIETYVVALAVDDVPPGAYHYNAARHSLELLDGAVGRSRLIDLLYGQVMAETAPLLFFTSVVTDRIAYKYQHGRAYRLWMYNAGHAGQTFVLAATALGLGAFQTAAFRDNETDAMFGLDGDREFISYVLGCGPVVDLSSPVGIAPPPPR